MERQEVLPSYMKPVEKCIICEGPIKQCPHGSLKPSVEMKNEIFVMDHDDLGSPMEC